MPEKIVTLACVLFGLLCAVSIESWLRRRHGDRKIASDVYTTTLEKYSEFWLSQVLHILITVLVVGLIYAFGIGAERTSVIAYIAGAVTCFAAVFLGSRSFASGAISSSSVLAEGDIKGGMRASFRSGAVMGLTVVTAGLGVMSALFYLFKQEEFINVAEGFALGAALCGLIIRLSGAVLTSAHKLSESDEHNIDYTGGFAAIGADYCVTFLLAACSVVLLAEVGVDTSGVASTFTVSAAAKYPLVIMGAGIPASVIGIFVYRAGTGKYSDFGFTAGSFVAGILVFAASIYFSSEILGSRSYAYCIGFGLLAQLLSAEFCKFFSMGSEVFRRNLPKTRDDDVDVPMLHGLSVGLVSAIVPGLFTLAALTLSYSVAGQYGVALAAVGVSSIAAVNAAVREFAAAVSASCSFAEHYDDNSGENAGYYRILRRTSAKAKAAGRAYSSVSASITLVALIMAVSFKSNEEVINLSEPSVFGGMIFGTLVILVFMGLLIRSIIISTGAMLDSSGDGLDDSAALSSVRGPILIEALAVISPLIAGFLMGAECVIGFLAACIVTGMAVVFAFNNTGRYYDRVASDVLSSVIIIMTAVAIACTTAFIEFGGTFF